MTLLERYPEVLFHGAEFPDLQRALDSERQALRQAEEDLAAQLCVDSATWGLACWEAALGLAVEVEKNISFRRSRVKSKLMGAGVTTAELVQDVAASFSKGAVAVREDAAAYRVDIAFIGSIGVPPNMDDLTAALREIMPAHLGWDYRFYYNTWEATRRHTWAELKGRRWAQVKGEAWNG